MWHWVIGGDFVILETVSTFEFPGLLGGGLWDWICTLFQKGLIALTGIVYNLVDLSYQIFLLLAKTNIFKQDDYQMLVSRIYVVLGVVMLFVVAYNFLLLVIDPDKNKNGQSIEKLLKNIVTTFILIILTPSIFSFAFDIQSAILTRNNLIEKFFSSDLITTSNSEGSIADGGRTMAVQTFKAFFSVSSTALGEYNADEYDNYLSEMKNLSSEPLWIRNYDDTNDCDDDGTKENDFVTCAYPGDCSLKEVLCYAESSGDFTLFQAFAGNTIYSVSAEYDVFNNFVNGDNPATIKFDFLVAMISGAYLIYVIISFCFDLGVRVVKLAFYQIIAPFTIACRILPDKESIFKNWMSKTIQTFISVFIRVLIMQLGVYLIRIFVQNSGTMFSEACGNVAIFGCNPVVVLFATAFIILGILTFIKTSAKLICEVFGLEDVGGLGIIDKFTGSVAPALGFGAMLGGGVASAVRNFKHAKEEGGSGFKAFRSAMAGAASGMLAGRNLGRNAQSWSQMTGAIMNAANQTTAARDAREERGFEADQELERINAERRAAGKEELTGLEGYVAGHLAASAHRMNETYFDPGEIQSAIAAGLNKEIEIIQGFDKRNKSLENKVESSFSKVSEQTVAAEYIYEFAERDGFSEFDKLGMDAQRARSMYQAHEELRTVPAIDRRIESERNREINLDRADYMDVQTDTARYEDAVRRAQNSVDRRAYSSDIAYQAALEDARASVDISQYQTQSFNETAYNEAVAQAEMQREENIRILSGMRTIVEGYSKDAISEAVKGAMGGTTVELKNNQNQRIDLSGRVLADNEASVMVDLSDAIKRQLPPSDVQELSTLAADVVTYVHEAFPEGSPEYDPITGDPVMVTNPTTGQQEVKRINVQPDSSIKSAKKLIKSQIVDVQRRARKVNEERTRREIRQNRRGKQEKK